jgi:hypothetical protein
MRRTAHRERGAAIPSGVDPRPVMTMAAPAALGARR